ncbi:MAG: helix-turn-helix transcriptional regulator [Candidatus Binatia bacterium]|nr:helix-turn-helix transcriptional regulator [Candidatus Binatia bacterium]
MDPQAQVQPGATATPVCADELSAADAQFLAAFGKRIRELRARRGMTRKALAREAKVSERYLGQVEAGDGNISIILLRRIAAALNVSLPDIFTPEYSAEKQLIGRLLHRLPAHRLEEVILRVLREFAPDDTERRQRIALIGLRGAGKSTLGALLAAELQVPFIELDREVEQEAGLPLGEIFTLYGQAGYRRIERRCLERVLQEHTRAVIAVGGGVVAEEDTFALLLARCYTVWLKAAPEEHMERVLAQGDLRPMAGNATAMEDLKQILAAREPLYRRADAIVDTSGQTPQASLAALRQLVHINSSRHGG